MRKLEVQDADIIKIAVQQEIESGVSGSILSL